MCWQERRLKLMLSQQWSRFLVSQTFNNSKDFHRSQWNWLGVSQFKQAFSTGTDGSVLVRKKPCACAACIDQDWANCDLKVHFFCHTALNSNMIVVSPGTCRWTSSVGFETEEKQEEGANLLLKIFVPHLLSSLRRSEFWYRHLGKGTGSCLLNAVQSMVWELTVAWWFSGEY